MQVAPSPISDYSFHSQNGFFTVPSPLEWPSYPPLFQSELPPFFVSYRWWEDEAATTLWAFDVQEVRRVIRFGLFSDDNYPRAALQWRNSSAVDDFLKALVEPRERPAISNLSHLDKVEVILRRCRLSRPTLLPWSWFPSLHARLDPQVIVTMLDAESHFHFTHVSFEDCVRYSLGYPSSAIEWFLQQHAELYLYLLDYLDQFPEEIGRYLEVEKQLRRRSPFAHRAVAQCLRRLQTGRSDMPPSSVAPAFEFIAGPIQQIFKDHPPSLSYILKVLSALAVRFRRVYLQTEKMDWNRRLETSIPFLGHLLMSVCAVDFARNVTSNDEEDFSKLSEQKLITVDIAVKRIVAKWHIQCLEVFECCSALPELASEIPECILSLYMRSNYHALTAILCGFQRYRVSIRQPITINPTTTSIAAPETPIPSQLLQLMNPSRNHAAYRLQFQKSPGIPFLVPHIREFREVGVSALYDLLRDMRRSLPVIR